MKTEGGFQALTESANCYPKQFQLRTSKANACFIERAFGFLDRNSAKLLLSEVMKKKYMLR